MSSYTLSSLQLYALFDILTHHEAYVEVRDLKHQSTIKRFGFPLQDQPDDSPSSPLLQILVRKFALVLPGLRDVSPSFWHQKIETLFSKLVASDLSESYDKGSIGIRKTLATATAAMVEYCARGSLGGYSKVEDSHNYGYDTSNPDDVYLAWNDFLQQVVYGDLLEKMFSKAAMTDQLMDHEPLVQATHEYIFVIMASFLHYVLVVSPRGQSLLPLLTRAKDMMPWFVMRQTLRVGNAASMLNGMVKLLLAKMNISTVTQWFGAAKSDKGMNLLQQVISTVLGWDNTELKKRASVIEKDKNVPSKEQLEALRAHCGGSVEIHQQRRSESETQSKSIVFVVLSNSSASTDLSEQQHSLALEYLAIRFSIRDRQELINVFCNHQPDLLTSSVQDMVDVYDPIIRALHSAVDLSGGTADLQAFLHDLVSMSKLSSKDKDKPPPKVEDFVGLLKKHQGSSHRFIHQALKNGQEVTEWYRGYAEHAAAQYRQKTDKAPAPSQDGVAAAGDLTPQMEGFVSKLSREDKLLVVKELDAHAEYLNRLTQASKERTKTVVENTARGKSEVSYGPGVFLAKWQSLMDDTAITPAEADAPVRHGGSESVKEATRVDVDGSKKGTTKPMEDLEARDPAPPEVRNTIRLLQPGFRELLVEIAKQG